MDNQSASPISNKNNLPKINEEIKNNPSTSKNVRLFPEEPPEDKTTKQKNGLFDESDSDNESLKKTQAKMDGNFFREQRNERKTVNLFDDEPPELDFVPKINKPTNLFSESDDDDNFINNRTSSKKISIFDEKPPPDENDIFVDKKISNQPKKKVNLFDEDEFFSYIQDIKDKPADDSKNSSKEKITQKKISNLFSDDVEDDLFDSIIKKDVKPVSAEKEEKAVPIIEEILVKKRAYVLGEDDNTIVKKIPSIPKISNIFDDLPPEDDFDIFRTKKTDKKKNNLFEDLSDEDSINKSSKAKPKPKKSSLNLEQEIEKDIIPSTSKLGNIFNDEQKKEKPKLDSLFSDEPPEDDLFSKKITKNVSKPDVTSATSKLGGNLFSDESSKESEQDIFPKNSKKTEKPKLESLFGDEPPEDDLFSQIITKKVSKPEKTLNQKLEKDTPSTSKLGGIFNESSNELKKDMAKKSEKPKLDSLFGDEPDDDIFAKITKKVSKPEKSQKNLEPEVKKESEKNANKSEKPKLDSLFGDEPPDDDIFSKITKKVSKPEQALKDNINPLSSQLSSPDVSAKDPEKDIFSKKSTKSEKPKLESLFSDEPPDDDLFSTITKNVSKPLTNLEEEHKKDIILPPSQSLFSDEPSEELEKDHSSKNHEQIETISSPTEPEIEKNILPSTSKIERLFEDESIEDDLFTKKITTNVSKPEKSLENLEEEVTPASSKLETLSDGLSKEQESKSEKPKLESLFSDEPPDDDLFSNVPKNVSKPESLLNEKSSDDPQNDILSTNATKDKNLEEDNKQENITNTEQTEQEVVREILPTNSKLGSVFVDEPSEDGLFSKISKNETNLKQESELPSTSKSGSFLSKEPDADIFASSSENKDKQKPEEEVVSSPENDMFSSTANSPLSKSNKNKNLFSFTSKVLDEEISSDNEEVNNSSADKIDDKIDTKPSIISPQFNFLDEEPPLDPEMESWSKPSSYSTPDNHEQSHLEKSESVKPISDQSALNYPSIGLFDDLPPDDDDDDVDKLPSMPYTKTSHVYYDDTDLFLPITNPVKISSNLNLLNDEPPPVDDFIQQKDEIDFKDKLNLFLTPEIKIIEKEPIDVPKKISVSDLIQARTNEQKPVESPKKKIQPNKLNKNLSINVAALLPGAKRPSLKVVIVNDERNSPDGDSQNIVIETTPTFNTPSEASNPDILPSLSKSRVKIQVKRRPSTRRGRQENYRKSVHMNDEDDDNSLEGSDEKDFNKNKLSTKIADEIATTPKSSHVDESSIFKKVDVKKREISALLKKDKENNVSRRVNDSLFSSDDDDPLFGPVVKKIEKSVEIVAPKSKDVPVAKPILKIEKTKTNEKSIFGSEDEDDDLFGKSTKKVKSVKTIDKNKNNMFGDSDDDGDDIFSVKKPKGKKFKKNLYFL